MYTRLAHLCLFLLFFLNHNQEAYPHYTFRNLDVSNGLPDNTVRCISQDEQGFIWLGTFNGLCRFDGTAFRTFLHVSGDSCSVISTHITELFATNGGLWVGTNKGLDFFSIKDNCFYRCNRISTEGTTTVLTQAVKKIIAVAGQVFLLEESGRLSVHKEGTYFEQCSYNHIQNWYSISAYKDSLLLAHSLDGLYLIDTKGGKIISHYKHATDTTSSELFYSENKDIVYLGYGLGHSSEAYMINREHHIEKLETPVPPHLNKIVDYRDQTLFGTDGKGLFSYRGKEWDAYTVANSTISSDVIFALFSDRDQNLWVGTYRDGVNFYSAHLNRFKQLTPKAGRLTHKLVTAIAARDNQLYLGLDGGGLNVYNKSSGTVLSYHTGNSAIAGDNVLSISDDKPHLWLGIYQKGLCRFSPKEGTFKTYPLPPQATLWRTKEDEDKQIWLIGLSVYTFDKQTESYTPVSGLQHVGASEIAFDQEAIWISTRGAGIYKLDKEKKTILKHYTKESASYPLPHNDIPYIFIDSNRFIWLSLRNTGLFKLEEESGKMTFYGEQNGLTDKNVTSIREDTNGYLWIGSGNGLFRFNPRTETFIRFGKEEYLPSTQFNYDACFQKDDTLYFGSTNGLIFFNATEINNAGREIQPIYLQSIELLKNDSVIRIHGKSNAQAIRLSYDQNFFTIHFSTPEFTSPDKLQFSCWMEHFEEEWRNIKNDRQVTYTNLPPGSYRFYIRQLDGDGKWSNEASSLLIQIAPPWWRTNWAISLWVILTMGILYLAYRVYKHQAAIRQLVRAKEAEKRRVKRDNEMKLRFFTNISHEFRTPLSLIISPLEILIKDETSPIHRNKLSQIYKNARNMLNLVNQLLDFRKLETNGEKLYPGYGDLVEFTGETGRSFEETAQREHKNFAFSTETEQLYLSFDKDKMRIILNNLLSNAFKYTLEGADINLSIHPQTVDGQEYAVIRVADTGTGIPTDQLTSVFERFYRVDDTGNTPAGSGIGLHLVKEYVSLHSGKITVESTVHEGSVFTVWIPVHLQQPEIATEEILKTGNQYPEGIPASRNEQKTLLVVEDNSEFRQFLVTQLKTEFHVIQAPDGEEGELLALKKLPDLVITDIMMPKVDGVELCKRIKNNIQTSHIPVILLTARASDESIFTGYEAGADEYLSKPFQFDLLLLRIRKLIQQQEERKAQFRNSIEIKPHALTVTSIDEKFMESILKSIEKNMSNTEYSVEDLSSDTGLSRRGLYRKIQSVTGETPAYFIRSVRLKRAAQLLHDTGLTISEIADRAGFGTIKYFNKHFKEEFGVTPTQYRKSK